MSTAPERTLHKQATTDDGSRTYLPLRVKGHQYRSTGRWGGTERLPISTAQSDMHRVRRHEWTLQVRLFRGGGLKYIGRYGHTLPDGWTAKKLAHQERVLEYVIYGDRRKVAGVTASLNVWAIFERRSLTMVMLLGGYLYIHT